MARLVQSLLALALVVPAAAAPQLDLPERRRSTPTKPADKKPEGDRDEPKNGPSTAGGDVAGTKTRKTEKVAPILDEKGRPVGTATTSRVNVPGAATGPSGVGAGAKAQGKTGSTGGGLSLPAVRRADELASDPANHSGANETTAASPTAEPAAGADPFNPLAGGRELARDLYDELTRTRKVTDEAVLEIADHLARLGPDGVEVARFALQQDSAPVALAGARTLLQAGDGADADRVVRLLMGEVPPKAAASILRELMERDPVRGSNRLLAKLCAHEERFVRRAARKLLAPRLQPTDLTDLGAALESRVASARRGALELVASIDHPAAVDALLMRVTDKSTSVAGIAIQALARSGDERINFELQRLAFGSGLIGRSESLAMLALVEREDRTAEPLLTEEAIEPLLEALGSPLPFVSNVAAVGLAGIGFRSPRLEETPWLDDAIPSALVGVAAGARYFEGFDIVREPALRRLRAICGVTHGDDGASWARWWAMEKVGFRANRAVIEVSAEDATRLVISTHDPDLGPPILLAGSSLADDEAWLEAQIAEPLFLPADAAAALMDLLVEEGVFGFERLPGPRGAIGLRGRSLEVRVGSRKKSFRFSEGMARPWFSRVLTRVFALERGHSWQRYLVSGTHATTRDLFLQEREWWEAHPETADRVQRIEKLAFMHAASVIPVRRAQALEDLLELDDEHGTAGPEDVAEMMALLAEGSEFGGGARALTELTLRAVGLDEERAAGQVVTEEQRGVARMLAATLHDTYGVLARAKIQRVLGTLERSDLVEALRDERGLLRIAGAGLLSERGPSDDPVQRAEDTEFLVELALDGEAEVQMAAIRALPSHDAERARPILLDRGRRATGGVRSAALEALGQVAASSDVVDVLVGGLTAQDTRYHLPAARGLSQLGSPETVPLLISLLRATTKPALREEARLGLQRIGSGARLDLLSAMRSPDPALRREATLLLAQQLEGRTVPIMARLLVDNPRDETVLEELAVLTCVDYRRTDFPSDGYYRFWDEAEQRDPFLWFTAALERRRLRAPDAKAFEGRGTPEAREFLVALIAEFEPGDALRERARRELERLIGEPIGRVPADERAMLSWLQDLLARGEAAAGR